MKLIFSILFSLTIFVSSIPRADALVGLIISNRTTRSIGGIMTLAGVGGVATGIGLTAIFGNAYTFLALSLLGATTGMIGIVVLDEKTADLNFSVLELEKAAQLGVSSQELEIYNSEVEELNLVKSEIESQITKETTDQEILEQWKSAQQYLSSETLKVAAKIIQVTVEAKK